jgi:cell division septal protein FtsQ
MARRVELPASKLKARKRQRLIRISAVIVGAVLLFFGILVGLSYIPGLRVTNVAVTGTQTLATSTVVSYVQSHIAGHYAGVFPKDNIFLYPKQQIRDGLLVKYPVLSSADVRAHDFGTIAVSLVERAPRALWCPSNTAGAQGQGCYFMDENGVVYSPAPTFSAPVYVRYYGALPEGPLPKNYLDPERFIALSALVDAIAHKLEPEQIIAVSVDGAGDARMQFESGFELRFALRDQGGDIFERLSLALGAEPIAGHALSEFLYIDLRFGDKLYYKLKQAATSQ